MVSSKTVSALNIAFFESIEREASLGMRLTSPIDLSIHESSNWGITGVTPWFTHLMPFWGAVRVRAERAKNPNDVTKKRSYPAHKSSSYLPQNAIISKRSRRMENNRDGLLRETRRMGVCLISSERFRSFPVYFSVPIFFTFGRGFDCSIPLRSPQRMEKLNLESQFL